ncbi:hypothetical protein GIB67_030656 [Kingdonia uniflora]|uniref:Late embryogenesis abundant protein n=1 Tax=Kingdonia uniflora TaxID=39325 RepID=A0A7J7NIP6_9MAGN|nr:hypothetical protein GIB67_030656 [Kingdonia uniflora]
MACSSISRFVLQKDYSWGQGGPNARLTQTACFSSKTVLSNLDVKRDSTLVSNAGSNALKCTTQSPMVALVFSSRRHHILCKAEANSSGNVEAIAQEAAARRDQAVRTVKKASKGVATAAEDMTGSVNSSAQNVTQKTGDTAGKASDNAQDLSEKAKQTAQNAWGSAKEAGQNAKDTVVKQGENTAEFVKDSAETVKEAMSTKQN